MPLSKRQFLTEIAEHPDSDEPRLVYADWLDEQGDPQGEFIRTQISLNDDSLSHRQRSELESLERRLLRRHAKRWGGSLRQRVRRWFYDRGIVSGVLVDTQELLNHADELLDEHLITELRVPKQSMVFSTTLKAYRSSLACVLLDFRNATWAMPETRRTASATTGLAIQIVDRWKPHGVNLMKRVQVFEPKTRFNCKVS